MTTNVAVVLVAATSLSRAMPSLVGYAVETVPEDEWRAQGVDHLVVAEHHPITVGHEDALIVRLVDVRPGPDGVLPGVGHGIADDQHVLAAPWLARGRIDAGWIGRRLDKNPIRAGAGHQVLDDAQPLGS